MAEQDGYTVHEGPMADRRGTEWRKDAAELEARDRRRKENPMGALQNSLRSLGRDHAARAKSDGGTVDPQADRGGGGTRGGEE